MCRSLLRAWVTSLLVAFFFMPVSQAQTGASDDARPVDEALRILEQHDEQQRSSAEGERRRRFLYPTPAATLRDEDVRRFLRGELSRLEAIQVRMDLMEPPDRYPYFEGTFSRLYHPFVDRDVIAYDEGVYVIPGKEAYIGNFTYFPQRDIGSGDRLRSVSISGSIVFVGKRLNWDGRSENAMFIAEEVMPGYSLDFLRATPAFLREFEKRHANAVARQKQRLAQSQTSDDSGLGALFSIGLGAALIGGSDLSRLDKMDLAETFVSDLADGGDGMDAFARAITQMDNPAGGSGVFSGTQAFDTPGLTEAIGGMLNEAAGR